MHSYNEHWWSAYQEENVLYSSPQTLWISRWKVPPKLSGDPAAAGLGPFFLTCKLTQMGKLQTQQEGLCLRQTRCDSCRKSIQKRKAQCLHSLPNPFSQVKKQSSLEIVVASAGHKCCCWPSPAGSGRSHVLNQLSWGHLAHMPQAANSKWKAS